MTADINTVIRRCYSTVLEPSQWQSLLVDIATLLSSDLACIMLQERQTGAGQGVYIHGISADDVHSYGSYYAKRSDLYKEHSNSAIETIYTDRSTCNYRSYLNSEIYTDFWRPLDFQHALAGVCGRQNVDSQTLNLRRSAGRGDYTPQEIKVMQLLLPHVIHSLQLSEGIRVRQAIDSLQESYLYGLNTAVMLLDLEGHIAFINFAAEKLVN